MVKSNEKTDRAQQDEQFLGHDPFEDMDLHWVHQEEGEATVEILGQDPFADMDVEWVFTEAAPPLDTLNGETDGMFEREETPPDPDDRALAEEGAPELGQVVVERLPLNRDVSPARTVEERPLLEPTPAIQSPVFPDREEIAALAAVDDAQERSGPSAVFHFPDDFKWGVATASHQVEGKNIHNDWHQWEQNNGHIKRGHTSGLACNWWENAEADFDRAAAMGLNAMRLSIEWSRIEPQRGVFDESALARYVEMAQGLKARGIEPMITLHHFTNPQWMTERGGWEMPEAIDLFTRYVRRVVGALSKYCHMWCTINEPNVYGYMGYLEGAFPPGKSDMGVGFRVIRHLLTAHAAAYREIHAIQSNAQVGLAHNMRPFDPFNANSPLDRFVARLTDRTYNQAILTALTRGLWTVPLGFGLAWRLRNTLDWIGLNYYTRDLITFDASQSHTLFSDLRHASSAEMLDGEYGEFYPEGIFRCIQRLSRLGLPIYITENGVPDDDDDQRPRYLLTHLHQIWRAIQLCYPVMGYYHWTLVDNFEWAEGWTLRFGLIELDPATQARTPRPSARLYAETVGANAITPDVIDAYAPELRSVLLPG